MEYYSVNPLFASAISLLLLPSASKSLLFCSAPWYSFLFVVGAIWFWRRQWHPTPVLLPGKSHGQRSLVGCSPWGREELDTTERLHFHFSLSCIGERNGNPLQCSCLENPRDGGASWADVYGVAQSRTRLKQLSTSSSNSSSSLIQRQYNEANKIFKMYSVELFFF